MDPHVELLLQRRPELLQANQIHNLDMIVGSQHLRSPRIWAMLIQDVCIALLSVVLFAIFIFK